MINNIAPVAVFVYNRPDHAKLTIEALQRNQYAKRTDLFIFSDGPKITGDPERDRDTKSKVDSVRNFIATVNGFRQVTLVRRETNYGLARSIIAGVTEIVDRYGRIIVLEDDLITSPAFLNYMNLALERYETEKKVYSVSGYSYIRRYGAKHDATTAYFLPVICSWSWGTWKDRWARFDAEASGWERLFEDRRERRKFDFAGSVAYSNMLKEQMQRDIDSWAIRWYWSVYRNDGLTLYPLRSYVRNNGFDGSGVHTKGTPPGDTGAELNAEKDILFPSEIKADRKFERMAQRGLKGSLIARCCMKAKRIVYVLLRGVWRRSRKTGGHVI